MVTDFLFNLYSYINGVLSTKMPLAYVYWYELNYLLSMYHN